MFAWIAYGVLCLAFFTLIKLPDERIKRNIEAFISTALAEKNVTYTAGETELSYFLGITLTLKDISLYPPSPAAKVHIDQIEVSPGLLSLLLGKVGGSFSLSNPPGKLTGQVFTRGSEFMASFEATKLDLGKLGLLPILAGIQGGAVLEGSGSVEGNVSIPSTLENKIKLNLKQVTLDAQTFMGFALPKIQISDSQIEIATEKAKAVIKKFKLGKPGDDLSGEILGDVSMAKSWTSTQLNLKAHFSFSEGVQRAFVLLDALLGAGKQTDGSYLYRINGPATAPVPIPVGSGGK